jgi:hypothetical protein
VLWAVWGLVQAKEVVEALKNPKEGFEPDFDYLVSVSGGIATAGGRDVTVLIDRSLQSPTRSSAYKCSGKKQRSSVYLYSIRMSIFFRIISCSNFASY